MKKTLRDVRPPVRKGAIGAVLAAAILVSACQPAPGAGSPTPTTGTSSAPAATPTPLTY